MGETIFKPAQSYSKEDLINLRTSLSDGELPSDIFQLGLMNCALYLGQ